MRLQPVPPLSTLEKPLALQGRGVVRAAFDVYDPERALVPRTTGPAGLVVAQSVPKVARRTGVILAIRPAKDVHARLGFGARDVVGQKHKVVVGEGFEPSKA